LASRLDPPTLEIRIDDRKPEFDTWTVKLMQVLDEGGRPFFKAASRCLYISRMARPKFLS
jgi:hypothetical protein